MVAFYNDIDAYCCKVLRKNIQQGHLPEGTIDERDIKQLHASDFVGYSHIHLFCGIGGFPLGLQWANFPQSIRVLTGGFPCQDISNAGQRAGITGERSGLWKEMYRLVQEALDCGMAFDYILVENVAALVNRGLSTVLGDLAEAGYDAEWICLRASDVGAPHRRERIFVVAYPHRHRQRIRKSQQKRQSQCSNTSNLGDDSTQGIMEHPGSTGQQELNTPTFTGDEGYIARRSDAAWVKRTTQPFLGRVLDGLSRGMDRYRWPAGPGEKQREWEPARVITGQSKHRVARLKALGNAIVPQLIAEIGRSILEGREQAG